MKLSKKQKEIIAAMRSGKSLYENRVTASAKWCIGTDYAYRWGNVNGNIVKGILPLMKSVNINVAITEHVLNEIGKTIKL